MFIMNYSDELFPYICVIRGGGEENCESPPSIKTLVPGRYICLH